MNEFMSGAGMEANQEKEVTREQVVAAYKTYTDQGIMRPEELDLNNPDVKVAQELFDRWSAQEDAKAGDDEDLISQSSVDKTMLFIDAGFTDPEYLDMVLNDWLQNEASDSEVDPENPRRSETRQKIAAAMKQIRALLATQKSQETKK